MATRFMIVNTGRGWKPWELQEFKHGKRWWQRSRWESVHYGDSKEEMEAHMRKIVTGELPSTPMFYDHTGSPEMAW